MPIRPPRPTKKPKLKKGDAVFVVEMPDGPVIFNGRVTTVDAVTNGKVKVKGSQKEYNETGEALNERAILIPKRLKDAWSTSPFLRDFSKLTNIVMNIDMLRTLDAENDSQA